MTGQLSRENAFRTYKFAAGVAASAGLQNAAQLFIETTFHPVLNLFVDMGGSTLKEFLAATKGRWESVLSADVPVCEELLFYALLGWIEHDLEKRQGTFTVLLPSSPKFFELYWYLSYYL